MGIFDFLKKKKPSERALEKISFEEINKWINKKKQEIEDNQKEPQKQIRENLSELLQKLEGKVIVLKNLDLEEKKASERTKLIVGENLSQFIDYLEKSIINLKELNSESFEMLINKINLIFSDFEKKSLMNFQKSTFLIGKELGAVGDDIAKFFNLFNKTIKKNESLIEQQKIILVVEKKLAEFNEIEKNKLENDDVVKEIEEKIKDFEEKIQNIKKEIEEKKESSEYLEQIKTRQKLETAKTRFVIELQELRELIDFKALADVYHSIGEQMSIVKEYRDNFKEGFEKYGSEKFLELADIKAINQEPIKEKIKTIDDIKQEINNIKIEEYITEKLEKEIEDIKRKIEEFNLEKSGKERRKRKLKENKEELKREIIAELEKIKVVVGC